MREEVGVRDKQKKCSSKVQAAFPLSIKSKL